MPKVKECKCAAVGSVVLKNDEELCGRCRKPLSKGASKEFNASLAQGREAARKGAGSNCLARGDVYRADDPNWVPPEHRSRDPRHDPTLGNRDIEKVYAAHAEEMRSRGTGKSGRVVACIPPELHAAKKRLDPHYWEDPKNMRKHREFMVNE